VKQDRISQTALKVALGLVTLSIKDDWAGRLPTGLVELSERLLLASGAFGFGSRLMRASKKQWMVRVHEFQDRMMPGQWQAFGLRKIYIQQQVERAIEQGARQVLVLGAGFDTLCLRLAPQYGDVNFFEVDHPATSAAKGKGIAEVGRPENVFQIAADLGENSLSKVLSEDGRWQVSQPAMIVAEGLLQYLRDEDVRGLFREAAACSSQGSRIVFTHAIPHSRKLLPVMLWLTGEPWLSAVRNEELPGYVEGLGWTVISDVDTDVAHGLERYAVAELG